MKPNCHVCGKFEVFCIAEAIAFWMDLLDLDHVRSLCQNAVRMHQRMDAPTRQGLSGPREEAG